MFDQRELTIPGRKVKRREVATKGPRPAPAIITLANNK